ncbi:MAG: thiamine diphosphokinase [Bacteroidaceae bacterium]|nr:thiamine diphosphokinase [Bacteroidaceae bacterium]
MNWQDDIFEAVVIGGGEYPKATQPLQVIGNAPYVVCCDGAADEYISNGAVPDAIVGDGDSISAYNRAKYTGILHCISEQDSNDQTKAVRFLLERGVKKIAIVGATGKREDHTIGNISLLMEYVRMGADVCMFTDYGVFIPCKGDSAFKCRPGQQLSIFNFTASEFSSLGLKYPIYDFISWWQGTLNECVGESFSVSARGEYLLFLNY